MNDTKKAEEKVVETETTQVESPTTEKPITGAETTAVESDDQGATTESSDEPTFQTEEQRRAFQEMRLENKRLKEEAVARKEDSAFSMFRAQNAPNTPPSVRVENFQDSLTGEVNWTAFNQAQQQREQALLQQARFEAQQTTTELVDEERARTKFPELMNDPKTEKLIAAQWFFEKAQGNNRSISDIAGEFARNFKQAASKAEKIGAERILNEVSEKEQAGLVAESQTSSPAKQAATALDQEDLVQRTRKGDENAIYARISKIPWANK